jgi:hypothetical protein
MGPIATTKTMFSQCPDLVGSILQTSTYTFHAMSPSKNAIGNIGPWKTFIFPVFMNYSMGMPPVQ